MSWIGKFEEPAALVPEGTWPAIVTEVREKEGPHGPLVNILFNIISDDEYEGRTVTGLANRRISEITKLGRWLVALLGHTPAIGEEIAVEDILHKECRVVVGHKTNGDGKTFANVTEVLPAESAWE